MDISGSMDPYLTQVKNNIINIINRMNSDCPGIDINMGYVGYIDHKYFEYNVNIEFTRDYEDLQNKIKNVTTQLGIPDPPEDIPWGMERALEKNWKSNARFAILIADYPCHGYKYHSSDLRDSFPNGDPTRMDIEVLINNMAEKNISLFCMKITKHTDIMFQIFENIYNSYTNCQFKVVPLESDVYLSDIVVHHAAKVYVSQRNIDNN